MNMDGVWKALGSIFSATGIYIFYELAHESGIKTKNLWKSIIKGVIAVAIIGFIASSYLGTHTEDCDDDPIYGRCDRVQDYEPTSKQHRDNFLFWFTYGSIPVVYGLYKGRQEADIMRKKRSEQEQVYVQEHEKGGRPQ